MSNQRRVRFLLGIFLGYFQRKHPKLIVSDDDKKPAWAINAPPELAEDEEFRKILKILFWQLGLTGPFETELDNKNKISLQWWDLKGGGPNPPGKPKLRRVA